MDDPAEGERRYRHKDYPKKHPLDTLTPLETVVLDVDLVGREVNDQGHTDGGGERKLRQMERRDDEPPPEYRQHVASQERVGRGEGEETENNADSLRSRHGSLPL